MNDIGSIAIIGAGAVGLYYGGRLAEAGHEVHFYSRSDEMTLRDKGLTARSHHGDFAIPAERMRAYGDVTLMPRVDWVVSTLKATARSHYRELIEPLLKPETTIVALQNGIGNEEELSKHFGADRVLGAIAYVCIHRTSAGNVNHSAQGELKVGEFGGPATDRLRQLAQAMRDTKIVATVVDDLRYHRWHKQVWNIAFNGLGAARNMDCRELLSSEAGRNEVREVMADVVRAARAVGVVFDDALIDFQINRTAEIGAYKTSMQLDRIAGAPMEIEAIVGEPIRQAAAAGITDLPALKSLYAELCEIDTATKRE